MWSGGGDTGLGGHLLDQIEPTSWKATEASQCSQSGFTAERAAIFSRIVRTCFQILKSFLGMHKIADNKIWLHEGEIRPSRSLMVSLSPQSYIHKAKTVLQINSSEHALEATFAGPGALFQSCSYTSMRNMITGYRTLRHELSPLNHFQPQQDNTSWFKYIFEVRTFTIDVSFPHIFGHQANKSLDLFCSYFIVRTLYILRNICSLEIHLTEPLAHMFMTGQSQIEVEDCQTVTSVPYKEPYSITRSKMRKEIFSVKPPFWRILYVFWRNSLYTLGEVLEGSTIKPVNLFCCCFILLANLLEIIKDELSDTATFLKILKLSSKERCKYFSLKAQLVTLPRISKCLGYLLVILSTSSVPTHWRVVASTALDSSNSLASGWQHMPGGGETLQKGCGLKGSPRVQNH